MTEKCVGPFFRDYNLGNNIPETGEKAESSHEGGGKEKNFRPDMFQDTCNILVVFSACEGLCGLG